jgi:hypothetical protein
MLKRLLMALMCLTLIAAPITISGCATFCKNAPTVATNLQNTVDTLKATVAQLQAQLLAGYDAEIEMAYLAAKVALSTAQSLLAQWCPDPTKVADVVKDTDVNVVPKARKALMKRNVTYVPFDAAP